MKHYTLIRRKNFEKILTSKNNEERNYVKGN